MNHSDRVRDLLDAHFARTKSERPPDDDDPRFTYYATILSGRVHVRFEVLGDVDPAKLRTPWDEAKAELVEHGYRFVEGSGPYKGWFTIPPDG